MSKKKHKRSGNKSKAGQKPTPVRKPAQRSDRAKDLPVPRPWAFRAVLVLVVLAGAGLGVVFWGSPSAPIQDEITLRRLDELEPQLAAHLLTLIEACRENPNAADAWATLGLAYEANTLWDEALPCYKKVVALDPTHKLARYHLGMALDELDDYGQALEHWRRLLVDYPDFAPAHHRLGDRLLDKGRTQEAIQAFQRTIDLLPQAAEGYVGLGDAFLRMGRHAEATPLLQKATQLNPRYRMAHYLLGLAYRGLGRIDEARRELTLGADAWRQYLPDAWAPRLAEHARRLDDLTDRARELASAGRAPEAVQLLEDLLQWHSDNAFLLNNLASIYLQQKKWDQASRLLHRAEGLADTHFATYINLSSWAIQTGQLPRALAYADQAVKAAPNVAQSFVARYHALRGLGRVDQALNDLRSAVQLDAKDPRIAMELANQYMMLNRPAEALPQYAEAIRRNPFQVTPYLGLCESNARLGRFQKASDALQAAERVAPGDPMVASARQRLRQAQNR
ncbi:MAG: tetratricopeptide repeat protein [Phycisphaerae bacterium]